MLRVRWGDECAFAELYRRYNRRLLDFFYGMSSNAHTAEDLSHETFARIWQVRRKYAATGSFPAYLFTFARNIWLEDCRRQRKQWRLGSRRSLDDGPDGVGYELAAAESYHPDRAAYRAELSSHILAALDALPDEQRMVFVMRNVEGLSITDIATVLQCPENTVRSRKILAIKKLRESLRESLVS
ncbi:MAG: sigma-70 family RNA polymerase sigma factor [Candidatus Hydrogenedentes bacterium]|nr:sigma-70 family RNA polymerase sigma factor [Candidatus Hydrogenedentota bacterium]